MIANDPSFQQEEMGLSRVEYAYRKIKSNITTNIYPSGFQILEPELAKKLGVSRTPVREALIRLEADKLIQLIPRRGMLVASLNTKDVSEIIDIQFSLLYRVVESVCDLKSDQLERFSSALSLLHEHSTVGDWVREEENFFIALSSAANNVRLKVSIEGLFEQVRRAKIVSLNYIDGRNRLLSVLDRFLSALKLGEINSAINALKEYGDVYVSLVAEVREKHHLREF